MNKLLQRFAARPALRYLVLIAAVLVAWAISRIVFELSDAPGYKPIAPLLAYLLATPIWIVFAVRDRRRLIWRLLLVWAPMLLPIASLVDVVIYGDNDTGLGYLFALLLMMVFGFACFLGCFAVLVHRPADKLASRPG